jgi:renalase
MTRIAIIGAGVSGLTVANNLKNHAEITIFEKARSVGGRMSNRRAEPYFFDHGAQYFSVKTDEFKALIAPMINDGIVKSWNARFAEIEGRTIIRRRQWDDEYPHYVGVPSMSSIAKRLSDGMNLKLGTRVHSISKQLGKWSLINGQGRSLGEYDWVISAIPAEQAAGLLPLSSPLYREISLIKMEGCFSLMLGFDQALPLEFDSALIRGEDISWISVNSSKPDRKGGFCLLVHSTNSWADAHRDDDRDEVMHYLCQQTRLIIGHDVSKADHKAIHGWHYANSKKLTGDTHFIDTNENIGVCGDWCIQGRVEAAFISGFDLGKRVLTELNNV